MDSVSRGGFRRYRVVRKTVESDVITSFEIVPADGSALARYEPGQFLTFQVDPGDETAGTRHYSLSGDPGSAESYRISVKREAHPAGRSDLPPGRMSSLLHDGVAVGDELMARGPEGNFVLDRSSLRPVVLLSGGVGLTPLVAMAHSLCAEGTRRTWFIHACEGSGVHALGEEIRTLAKRSDKLKVHVCYRAVAPHDQPGVNHDSEGLVTRELLQSLLPLDDYDFYLCGPAPFMEAVYSLLEDLGVREERIRYEFFGPATILKRRPPTVESAVAAALSDLAPDNGTGPAARVITFAKSGRTAVWTDDCDNLLEFAEAQALNPAFSCRAGICFTCACGILEGDVDYHMDPLDPPPPGVVLLCCSRPRGSVTLAL